MQKLPIYKHLKYKLFNVLSVILVVTLFLFIFHSSFWSKSVIRNEEECVMYEETSWVLEDVETGEKRAIDNDKFVRLTKDKLYRVSTKLTFNGNNVEMPYGFFHADHIFCRILFDGKEMFHYMPEDVKKHDKARSPGFIDKDFPLPTNCKGKTLTIEFLPVLRGNISYNVADIFFGDYKAVIHNMIRRDLPHNVIALLCMLLGFSSLVFSVISLKGSDFKEGIIIGSFALILSLYSVTESLCNRYYIANPYYLYFLNYLTFSLIPLSFMCVMREIMDGAHYRIIHRVIIAHTIFILCELVLHFTGLVDMRELLVVVHIIAFCEIILFTVLLFTIPDKKNRVSVELQILPITIGAILDAFIYWLHIDLEVNDATFTIIGILIFLFRELIGKLINQTKRLTAMQQHTIEGMATLIESRDGSTGSHVRNTGVYAQFLAQEMYLRKMYPLDITADFVEMIGLVAPLHDVGKIKISDTILNKPGKFTKEEYEIMKTHAELGGEIIGDILRKDLDPHLLSMAQNIATYHHERWDGKGYPKGLKGEEIPIAARIMSVADVFDALTSVRVYKDRMNIDDVFNEMRESEGKQFQKELVEVFISLRPEIEDYIKTNNS